jgi:hypothetical protein
MSGFVYILSNPAMPNLLKIGKSDRDPTGFRAAELYTTGVPQPFKVEYFAYVEEHHNLERKVHSTLSTRRPNSNREFFTVSIEEAVLLIRESGLVLSEKLFFKTEAEIRAEKEKAERRLQEEYARKVAEEEARLAKRAYEERKAREIEEARQIAEQNARRAIEEEQKRLREEQRWKASMTFANQAVSDAKARYWRDFGKSKLLTNTLILCISSVLLCIAAGAIELAAFVLGIILLFVFPLVLSSAESEKNRITSTIFDETVLLRVALLHFKDEDWQGYLKFIAAGAAPARNERSRIFHVWSAYAKLGSYSRLLTLTVIWLLLGGAMFSVFFVFLR